MKTSHHVVLFLIFFYFSTFSNCFAQGQNSANNLKIAPGSYTLASLITQLNEKTALELSYNPSVLNHSDKIIITKSILTLDELINEVNSNSNFEFVLTGNYLIIRFKKVPEIVQISGRITDSETKEILIGATITVDGIPGGTVSDASGAYSLQLAAGYYTIHFSYVGYITYKIELGLFENKSIDIELMLDKKQLEEIWVLGERQFFGNLNQGRAIESIKLEEIKQTSTNNVSDVLQARIPGMWITKVSGAPGDHIQIRIRGLNSLFGGVDPLFVIDGVPVPMVNLHSLGISDLNVHDVENITVLKDASSAALYGFQGGNGVIIIDTKRGHTPEFNFSVTQGVQQLSKSYSLFNSAEQKNSLDSASKRGIGYISAHYPVISDTLRSDDWQKNLFRVGYVQDYQMSTGGNIGKVNYYISGNVFSHSGIVTNSNYKKYSLSVSAGRNFFKKLTVEAVYKPSFQLNHNNLDSYWGNRVIYESINKSPSYYSTTEEYYIDTNSHAEYKRSYISYPEIYTRENPKALIDNSTKELKIINHSVSAFVGYQLSNNLKLNYSMAYATRDHDYYTNINAYEYLTSYNNYLTNTEDYALLNNQVNLNYNFRKGKHSCNFVGSGRFYRNMVEWEIDSLQSPIESGSVEENLFTKGNLAINGEYGKAIRHINSLIGHINYGYDSRYNISIAANYERLLEGTSRDISGFFPSLALKWDIAAEEFLSGIDFLDHLNLIYSWGRAGNYPLNGLSRDLFSEEFYIAPNQKYSGYALSNLANHNLQPEIVTGYNSGVEIDMFSNRLFIKANYYSKHNQNLIVQREIPAYYGGGKIFINIAEMQITGNEIAMEAFPISNKKYIWFTRISISSFDQKVTKLDESSKYYYHTDLLIPDFEIKENEPIGSILGYEYLGKVKKGTVQTDYENVVFHEGGMYTNADTLEYLLTNADKVIIGNILPDYSFNFYNSLDFERFNIEMLWYAVMGAQKFNSTRATSYFNVVNSETNILIADTNKVLVSKAFYESSYFVEDASFLRLKSIGFGYSPEKLINGKIQLHFTLGAENLITFTRYKGYDPEATIYTDNIFSDNAIDLGSYPNPRSYYIKIDLKF